MPVPLPSCYLSILSVNRAAYRQDIGVSTYSPATARKMQTSSPIESTSVRLIVIEFIDTALCRRRSDGRLLGAGLAIPKTQSS